MTMRVFPMSDWAPAQESALDQTTNDSPTTTAAAASGSGSGSGSGSSSSSSNSHNHNDAAAPRPATGSRHRSLSLSLPWRHRKSSVFGYDHLHHLPPALDELAIEDTDDDEHNQNRRPSTHHQAHGHTHGHSHSHSHGHGHGSIKGIIRRASLSIKGIVHRRPSISAEHSSSSHQHHDYASRPTTSHSAWTRLRQAANRRQSRSGLEFDDAYSSGFFSHRPSNPSHLPIPGFGGEPPVIPTNSGAAAKAAAAMQNDYLAKNSLQNKWLSRTASSDDGNDRESGIGISPSFPSLATDYEGDSYLTYDHSSTISKVDFVSTLPTELAIHVLACLDSAALAKASLVSREWNKVISNQHVWRESCLREMATTFATSGPVAPGTGLGLPTISPDNDWKEIYRVKQELNHRWKAGKARPIYLNGHTDSIYCLQFDEHKIITGSRDRTIRVWDMHTLECRMVIGPPEIVNEADMLRDEDGNPVHYAAGSDNQRTSESTPTLVSFPTHHKASILCLQYDEEILVTGSSDSTCIVYGVQSGYRPIRRLRHHTAAVLDLAFDDKHIVTCSKDISICVWDRETGNLVRQLRGHTGPVNAVQMRANTIVSCSGDFRVKLWNIDTGKNIREFSGHTKGLACSQFSEDGRYIASAGNDKVIRIWDANTGECVREMRAHENLVRSLHIDSVSGRLVSGSYDTDIKVWDMETGHQLLDFPKWHASWVLSAKSDYRRIISTGQDPKILIMDFGADVEGIDMLESGGRKAGTSFI